MADLPVLGFGVTGPIFTDCTIGGDTFINAAPQTVVLFRNKNANPRTITVLSPNFCSFGIADPAHDRILTIPGDGGLESYLRVTIDPSRHNDANGVVTFNYSAVAGLSAAVLAFAA